MANEISKFDAIKSLTPNADFGVGEDGTITWKDYNEDSQPSDSDIDTEKTRLQTIYDGQDYARKRKAKYDLLNQDEMRYDDLVNSTTTWQDAIAAIKAEFPKS